MHYCRPTSRSVVFLCSVLPNWWNKDIHYHNLSILNIVKMCVIVKAQYSQSLSCNDPGQVVHTHVPLSPSMLVKWRWRSSSEKLTPVLAESGRFGSLPLVLWLVTYRLTAYRVQTCNKLWTQSSHRRDYLYLYLLIDHTLNSRGTSSWFSGNIRVNLKLSATT